MGYLPHAVRTKSSFCNCLLQWESWLRRLLSFSGQKEVTSCVGSEKNAVLCAAIKYPPHCARGKPSLQISSLLDVFPFAIKVIEPYPFLRILICFMLGRQICVCLLNVCHVLSCHGALASNAFTLTAGSILYQKGKMCVCRRREKIYDLQKIGISEMWLYSCQSTCNVCSLLLPYVKWFRSPRKNRFELQKRHPCRCSCPSYTSIAFQRAGKYSSGDGQKRMASQQVVETR